MSGAGNGAVAIRSAAGAVATGGVTDAALLKRQMELAKKLGLGRAVPTEIAEGFMKRVSGGISLNFRLSNVYVEGSGGGKGQRAVVAATVENSKVVARIIMPSADFLEKNPQVKKFHEEETGLIGIEVPITASEKQLKKIPAVNAVRDKYFPLYVKDFKAIIADAYKSYCEIEDAKKREEHVGVLAQKFIVLRYGEKKAARPDRWIETAVNLLRKEVMDLVWTETGVRHAIQHPATGSSERDPLFVGNIMMLKFPGAAEGSSEAMMFRSALCDGDADTVKEALAAIDAYTAKRTQEIIERTWGKNVYIPPPEQALYKYYVNKDNWMKMPKEEKCAGVEKLLKLKTGYFTLTGVNLSYSVREVTDPPTGDNWHYDLPSGVPTVYLNTDAVRIDSTPMPTVVRALDFIDFADPTGTNTQIDHYVPDLWTLAARAKKIAAENGTTPEGIKATERALKEISYMVHITSEEDMSRIVRYADSMYSRFSLTGDKERLLCGKDKDRIVLDGLATLTQWRDETADKHLTELDDKESTAWSFSMHVKVYGSAPGDTLSLMAACPMHEPAAWANLAPFLCEGIDFYLEFCPDIEESLGVIGNDRFENTFASMSVAERMSVPMYSLNLRATRMLCDWARQVFRNSFPVSAASAKELFKVIKRSPRHAVCADPANYVVALNEVPEGMENKYLADPNWRFEVLLPFQWDEEKRELYQLLRESATDPDKPWTGPLCEVLLDSTYKPQFASEFGAHPLIVERRVPRIEAKGEMLSSKMYIFAVDVNRYNFSVKQETVEACLSKMFNVTKPVAAPVAAAAAITDAAPSAADVAMAVPVAPASPAGGKRTREEFEDSAQNLLDDIDS